MEALRRGVALLAQGPDLRRLVGAQCLAQAADGVAQAAFYTALVLDPLGQGTPTRILYVFALTLLPYSVLGPFLGVLVDRWSRRGLLVGSNLLRAALLISLPLWGAALPGLTELYVGLLALLGLGRLFLTTKGAALPSVLPAVREGAGLLSANAVSSGAGMISAFAGGVVGLTVIGSTGLRAGGAFVVAGAAYALSAAAAGRISTPLAGPPRHRRRLRAAWTEVARDLWEGFRAVAALPAAWIPLAGIFVLRSVGVLVAIGAVLFIRTELPGIDEHAGRISMSAAALGSAGLGALLGAALAPALGRRFDEPRLILLGFAISAAGALALGGIGGTWAVIALMAAAGLGGFVTKVATDAQLQAVLPDDHRGRAFALYDILYNVASVAAGGVMVLCSGSSLRVVLPAAGGATLAVGAALGLAMRRLGVLTARQ